MVSVQYEICEVAKTGFKNDVQICEVAKTGLKNDVHNHFPITWQMHI